MADTLWLTERSGEMLEELTDELPGNIAKNSLVEKALEDYANDILDDND